MTYFANISSAVKTTLKGMSLALSYFFDARKKRKKEWITDENYFHKAEGTFTVQYPSETIPVPDTGRYQLNNEIDDCIVCDKCAKVCPVDCIDIEPIRSPKIFGYTSDGTAKRIHAAKFDIDMAKCCFCGLCTVVCPTECLTMTKDYDFSTANILDHNFSFSKMTEKEIAQRKEELEVFQAEKAKAKDETAGAGNKTAGKPIMKPKAKPMMPKVKPSMPKVKGVAKPIIKKEDKEDTTAKKPIVKPKVKPLIKPKVKPVMKPQIKPKEDAGEEKDKQPKVSAKKPVKPIMRPKIPKKK